MLPQQGTQVGEGAAELQHGTAVAPKKSAKQQPRAAKNAYLNRLTSSYERE